MSKTTQRIIIIVLILSVIGLYYAFGLDKYFSLEGIKQQQEILQGYKASHPLLVGGSFFVFYIAVAALSLPAAAILTLLAGALFGAIWGTVLVSFASTIGATLAMLASRYILRDSLQTKYGKQLKGINEGFAREGAFYLFAIRLVPVVPFFMVNLLMGLLPIRTFTYFWISQLGMLPGTIVYVYAGTALASINSFADIASPRLLLAFALLGLLPIAAKFIVKTVRKGKPS